MKYGYSYAHEKLFEAMQGLALGAGDVRSRLEIAFESFYTLETHHFPKELQKDWEWVMKQMTRFGPLYRADGREWLSPVHHTMQRIKNKTGVKIAEKIFYLFWKLESDF